MKTDLTKMTLPKISPAEGEGGQRKGKENRGEGEEGSQRALDTQQLGDSEGEQVRRIARGRY